MLPTLHLLTYFNLRQSATKWLDAVDGEFDRPSIENFPALYLACRLSSIHMVRLLLLYNANPSRENGHHIYCLSTAASWGHKEVMEKLLRHSSASELVRLGSCSVNRYPLTEVVVTQGKSMLRVLYRFLTTTEDGLAVLLQQDNNGYSVLHEAAAVDKADLMEELIRFPGAEALLH